MALSHDELNFYRNALRRMQQRLNWMRQHPDVVETDWDSMESLEQRTSALTLWLRDQARPTRLSQLEESSYIDSPHESQLGPRHAQWVAQRVLAMAVPPLR